MSRRASEEQITCAEVPAKSCSKMPFFTSSSSQIDGARAVASASYTSGRSAMASAQARRFSRAPSSSAPASSKGVNHSEPYAS
jgi:hypothetical protein